MLETRSHAAEIMDDFSIHGEDVKRALRSIERVNYWLGGTRVLLSSFERATADSSLARLDRALVVHDLGCGGGDGLRELARWGRQSGIALQLTGVDANASILAYARDRSLDYPEIRFEQRDILHPSFAPRGADVVTLNLCLHHFTESQITTLLRRCRDGGVRAVIVNDLHRHWLAYSLFSLVCVVFGAPRIARLDGLLSVCKGFRRDELADLADAAGSKAVLLRWRWAFRYQLVLFFR